MNRSSSRIGLALVAAALAFALVGCGITNDEAQVEPGPAGEDAPNDQQAGGNGQDVAKIGDTLSLKGTSYKVTSVKTQPRVGDNEFTEAKADGVFVVVKLTLTNKKDEPATIIADLVRLRGGNGKEYSVDTDALFAFDNALVLLEELQPDLSRKVVAVYDVPKKAVKGARLVVKDLFSEATGEIDLGLQ